MTYTHTHTHTYEDCSCNITCTYSCTLTPYTPQCDHPNSNSTNFLHVFVREFRVRVFVDTCMESAKHLSCIMCDVRILIARETGSNTSQMWQPASSRPGTVSHFSPEMLVRLRLCTWTSACRCIWQKLWRSNRPHTFNGFAGRNYSSFLFRVHVHVCLYKCLSVSMSVRFPTWYCVPCSCEPRFFCVAFKSNKLLYC